MIFVCKNTTT